MIKNECKKLFIFLSFYSNLHSQLELETTTIQQIGPLFCFGQNIVPPKQMVLRAIPFFYKQTDLQFDYISQQLIYGIKYKWIVLCDLPIVFKNCGFGDVKGFGAFRLQTEYAYYKDTDSDKSIQATFVLNGMFPNFASTIGNPLIKGAPSFFCGTTASYLSDWYFYGSLGFKLYSHFDTTKFGNQVFYEWIVGHRLPDILKFTSYFLIEFNGLFSQQNRINCKPDANTGSNLIYCGPVLSLTSKSFGILAGIQGLIHQHLNGDQKKMNLRAAIMLFCRF